ncbi:MAG TPA: hypothetical protein VFE13_04165 [Caulobacteraceae bacterium]|nr:hypothetical protein [Caulobacteraceae bacterium]
MRSPAPPPPPDSPALAVGPAPVAPPTSPDLAGLSRALHAVLGCDQPHLTQGERIACGVKLAASRPTVPTALNLDPNGRYISDPEPYLNRMPKNGCKPRAAGRVTLFGKEGVAAGVTCAWSF